MDEEGFSVLGGQAESIAERSATVQGRALARRGGELRRGGARRDQRAPLAPAQLEVGFLDRAAVERGSTA